MLMTVMAAWKRRQLERDKRLVMMTSEFNVRWTGQRSAMASSAAREPGTLIRSPRGLGIGVLLFGRVVLR